MKDMTAMHTDRCPVCGSTSLATVLSPLAGGGLSRVCTDCQERGRQQEREAARRIARHVARLLTYAGLILIVLALAADRLSIAGRAGFGWRQITGAEVGFVAVVVGLLSGRSLLGLIGLFLLVLSVGADLLQVGSTPGLGWRSQIALVFAFLLVTGGVPWLLALRRPRAPQEGSPRQQ
jgi:hypothetical protein